MARFVAYVVLGALAGIAAVTPTGHASLHSPHDPFVVPVGNDGQPTPLPFEEFKRRLAILTNALIEPKPGEEPNPDRRRFLDRVARYPDLSGPAVRGLSNPEAAALATDLLRLGRSDQALDLLMPRTRRPDYFVLTVLGHVFAARGDWANALKYHVEERVDFEMPADVQGLTRPQRDWWARLDESYLAHYYRIRKQESDARRYQPPAELERLAETENILPLFPLPVGNMPTEPVRFVNDAGVYEPGRLAATERAKLPSDALAVVQQLLLWMPGETRLYWLLAELYTAADELDTALTIFDECAWARQYGNRKVLMEHRAAVRAALQARPRPETLPAPEDVPPVPVPITMRHVAIYFGVVILLALVPLVRSIYRRIRRF